VARRILRAGRNLPTPEIRLPRLAFLGEGQGRAAAVSPVPCDEPDATLDDAVTTAQAIRITSRTAT
jgi:hypothetical protein